MTTPKSARERWKSFERRVAAQLGGQRIPVTGRHSGDVPDIEIAHVCTPTRQSELGAKGVGGRKRF